MIRTALSLACLSLSTVAFAQHPADGYYVTIDDETEAPKGLVELRVQDDGELVGYLRGSFDPTSDMSGLCDTCEDELANQPVYGLPFVWGLEADGERKFKKGRVQDPEAGKTYKSKIKFNEDFTQAELRGYIGSPVLGRTQVWRRATDADLATINGHNANFGLDALPE